MIRIGFSEDIHRLEDTSSKPLILGGVKIPFEKGLIAHSDGDCLFHALAEALLGSLALGDLGTFFPDTDPKYESYDSELILIEVLNMVKARNYRINNVDINIVLEKLKLKDYILKIRTNVSRVLNLPLERVSIKAQTNEKLDSLGENKAVKATAIVLIESED